MKVLVELNSKEECFQIKDCHRSRLVNEFPKHEFIFAESYQSMKPMLGAVEAAVVWVFPEKNFGLAPNLKSLYTPAAGKNWVAEDSSGRVKTYFSKFHGGMIAESFMTMLLFNNNNLKPALDNKFKSLWDRNAFGERCLLKNQSLLIVGYGNIGYHCASAVQSLGVKVSGACRNLERKSNCQLLDIKYLGDYIGDYDHVLNLLPGDDSTQKFFSEYLLSKMKQGSSFYNFGRGTTVDENALYNQLSSKELKFAGLDVFDVEPLSVESKLWSLENVVITPHSSCLYKDYLDLFIDELHHKL